MSPADCPLPKNEADFSTDGAVSGSAPEPASKRERPCVRLRFLRQLSDYRGPGSFRGPEGRHANIRHHCRNAVRAACS